QGHADRAAVPPRAHNPAPPGAPGGRAIFPQSVPRGDRARLHHVGAPGGGRQQDPRRRDPAHRSLDAVSQAQPVRGAAGRRVIVVLSLLFLLSGAAGLFYEAVWSRYLSLFVGHDAYAQVLTLVIFLGGMGLGAWLVSRRSARLRDPLFAYAI